MPAGSLTARAVADLVGGRLCGSGDVILRRVRALTHAGPDELTMCTSRRLTDEMAVSRAGAVIMPAELEDAPGPSCRIIVSDPQRAMAKVARQLHPQLLPPEGIHPTAILGSHVTMGQGCRIGPGVVLGDGVILGQGCSLDAHVVVQAGARLGDEVHLDPQVTVYAGSVLGHRVICKAGAVIGAPGFGFIPTANGHQPVPQVGGCVLGDDVEIGSGSRIDRGSLGDTVVGRGTKIDNLVHVGHNVRLGEHCILMAGVGISGSTVIGDRVVIAGHAGVAGHLTIGDDVTVSGQAGVIGPIPSGATVSGFPARPHREFMRSVAAVRRLAPHIKALERLATREDRQDG